MSDALDTIEDNPDGIHPSLDDHGACPCFYFDPAAHAKTCECGHELDEHDRWGNCE